MRLNVQCHTPIKATTCSQFFPIKLTARLLQLAENFSIRQTTGLPQISVSNVCYASIYGSLHTNRTGHINIFQSTSVELCI
jgi:hypothetical protein